MKKKIICFAVKKGVGSGVGSGSGSISQRYVYPDPHQNDTDPQHCFQSMVQYRII
jgi:hypothetical protein